MNIPVSNLNQSIFPLLKELLTTVKIKLIKKIKKALNRLIRYLLFVTLNVATYTDNNIAITSTVYLPFSLFSDEDLITLPPA